MSFAAPQRQRPNILITGTPGTGKSTLVEMVLKEHPEMRTFDINEEATIHGCFAGDDEQRQCKVIDDELLLDAIEDRMSEPAGGFIIDYHATSFFPERYFDYVIVLRTDNTILFDRLSGRGYYSQDKIRENVECEIFGIIAEEVQEYYPNISGIKELKSDSIDDVQQNVQNPPTMCKMWEKIRYGARWKPAERLALANRALNLKDVKSINFSFDPFHNGNGSLREFLFNVNAPQVKLTNPQIKIQTDIRNDRQPPFFVASLAGGKKLKFKTEGMDSGDLVMRFNRLLGNRELGMSGTRIKTKI